MVKINTSAVAPAAMEKLLPELQAAHTALQTKSGKGSEFTGWVTLPADYDKAEFARIQSAAQKIQSDSQVLVVVGIGGSYLGARAVLELLNTGLYNNLCNAKNARLSTPCSHPSHAALSDRSGAAAQAHTEVYFAGCNLSGRSLQNIIDIIGDRDFSVNVISKSGTTTEPAVAFRLFRGLLETKYGKAEASARIYATTDQAKGTLKSLADTEGWETFVVPDDIGGRFSVLSAVGLLPIAVGNISITDLMSGAAEMKSLCETDQTLANPAFAYVAARNVLHRAGKSIEVLASFDPDFVFVAEWWKQLYGESEGKDGKGIYPASVSFTADLHSMGQYLQEGPRHMLETIVSFTEPTDGITIGTDAQNGDGLNFLAGKTVDFVNTAAFQGTFLAHTDGNLPVLAIDAGEKTAKNLGALLYFFEYACGLSGYVLDVNPFNQPGVEAYKKNMFALLGKPGFEAEGETLRARLVN